MKKLLILIFLCSLFYGCDNVKTVNTTYAKTIFIDPGHGGLDNGCDFENVYEDEINLKIASYLYEICLDHHIVSYISRIGDYDLASLYASNRKNEDLKKRATLIEQSNCDIFISLHLNYYKDKSVSGPMVYYEKSDENSYTLAKITQKRLNEFTNKNKICHYDNFYLFRKTSVPGILIECGFLSNQEERENLMKSEYQKALAKQIYLSINDFFNNK